MSHIKQQRKHSFSETTAARAEAEAPNLLVAKEVESNAEHVQGAAVQAASVAKTLGSQYTGEPTTAVDQFQHDASETTDKAVEEGKQSVEAAKALGADYVDQAKAFATSAIETVQEYLPAAVGGKHADPSSTGGVPGGYVSSSKETHTEEYVTKGTTPASSTGIPASDTSSKSNPH
ncbi:hypothetical protein K443DRAFT_134844 [Laccaria amethystina LaAM-08-1]|uniref:Uncharacterized protein n=1 Tax=Laccaria amethystina LaAM-08-1 TaxID=1095629 RepID=A0A0C9WYR6_9AGAR|nr:hypothetical protein K443DRAFT_134844 [Laccaria amethystina LaAM-08-1]